MPNDKGENSVIGKAKEIGDEMESLSEYKIPIVLRPIWMIFYVFIAVPLALVVYALFQPFFWVAVPIALILWALGVFD